MKLEFKSVENIVHTSNINQMRLNPTQNWVFESICFEKTLSMNVVNVLFLWRYVNKVRWEMLVALICMKTKEHYSMVDIAKEACIEQRVAWKRREQ